MLFFSINKSSYPNWGYVVFSSSSSSQELFDFTSTTNWFTSKDFWVRVFCLTSWKKHDKLDPRVVPWVFIGYSQTQKRISMLKFHQKVVCDLCGCHFLWKHTFSVSGFYYKSFDHSCYFSYATRRFFFTPSLSIQEDYHWFWQLVSLVNCFH